MFPVALFCSPQQAGHCEIVFHVFLSQQALALQ
jgi:hypothetical protein